MKDNTTKGGALRYVYLLLCALLFGLASSAQAETTPNQVVQGIVDDLGKTMDSRRADLQKDREALLKTIDSIVLPHFDIDYASILVLGANARNASPEQRARFAHAMYN